MADYYNKQESKKSTGTDYQCCFEDHGVRCNKDGALTLGLNDKWYCRWHYHCLTSGVSHTNEEAYAKFKEKENAYFEKFSAKKATPEQVARFLIRAGSKSIFWEKATEEQKQFTINYAKTTGYRGKDQEQNKTGLTSVGALIG